MEKKLIPNSTQIPNIILDLVIPDLPTAEKVCLLYICRRTFGFHRDNDRISFSQFMNGIKNRDGRILDKGTGLARASVWTALKNLSKSGAIFVKRDSKGNYYQINLEMDIDKVVQDVNQFRKQTKSSSISEPKPVQLLNTQKTEKQMETKVIASGSKEPSAYSDFIKFYEEMCWKTRGMKMLITGKDRRNLKRILDLKIVSEQELEQIALYYLANPYYKTYSPAISTFLSSGILNALVNSLKNRPTFWKELDEYIGNYAHRPMVKDEFASIGDHLKEMIAKKELQGYTP